MIVFEDLQCSAIKENIITYELIFDMYYKSQDSEGSFSIITKMVIVYPEMLKINKIQSKTQLIYIK